jgi:hypothetical protein
MQDDLVRWMQDPQAGEERGWCYIIARSMDVSDDNKISTFEVGDLDVEPHLAYFHVGIDSISMARSWLE